MLNNNGLFGGEHKGEKTEGYGDLIHSSTDPRARARFITLRAKKSVKEFFVKRRGYKRPDFNRMILDLGKMIGHTKRLHTFYLLAVLQLSLNGRVVAFPTTTMVMH